jgi:hypothetical protein
MNRSPQQRHQHPERIRLNGIGCPEKGQAYGKRIIEGQPYKQKKELMGRGIIPLTTYDKIKEQIVAKQK